MYIVIPMLFNKSNGNIVNSSVYLSGTMSRHILGRAYIEYFTQSLLFFRPLKC